MAQRRRCGSFGSLPYIERRAIDVEYGELTTRWSYSHVRSPPLAEAATPLEVVAQSLTPGWDTGNAQVTTRPQ